MRAAPYRFEVGLVVTVALLSLDCNQPSSGGPGPSPSGGQELGGALAMPLHVQGSYATAVTAAESARLDDGTATAILTLDGGTPMSRLTVWKLDAHKLDAVAILDVGAAAESLAVGDLDGDGDTDAAVGAPNQVSVFTNSRGALAQSSVTAVPGADVVRVADLDGDGRGDILAASTATGSVSVLLGQSRGAPKLSATWSLGVDPAAIVVLDVNGDGKMDVVAQGAARAGAPIGFASLAVLLGAGNGRFSSTATVLENGSLAVGAPAKQVASSGEKPLETAVSPAEATTLTSDDFDGDGRADVAFASSGDVTVLFARKAGGFQPAAIDSLGAMGIAALSEGVGHPALLAAMGTTTTGPAVTILEGRAPGALRIEARAPSPAAGGGIVGGDFDGDGKVDVAVTSPSSLTVMLNGG